EELASTLVAEPAKVADAPKRFTQRRDAAAGPVREIADGRWTERGEVAACDEIKRLVRLQRLAQLRRRRDEPGELTVLPARAALLPDDPARGDRGPEVPVAQALVLRRVARDELTDLVARARRRRALEDPVVDVLERGEIRSSRRPPRGEASIKGRERVRRVLLRAGEVKSRAHEGRLYDQALFDRCCG